jgi:integrase
MTQVCEAAGIPRFTPHDMKRTFVTRMAELKVEKHVMKSMSAHSTDEMLFHYDDVATERKAAAVDRLFDTLEEGQG